MPDFSWSQAASKFGQELANKSGLGRLSESWSKFSKNRLGKGKDTKEDKSPANFDVYFGGEKDFRVKLRVPDFYRVTPGLSISPELQLNEGIVFPYTPVISQDYTASYNTYTPMHSNYNLYFYKNSAPGAISVSGRFSVQTNAEAYIWLSTVHMLRALTKMRFGKDDNAGAPPPICRFDAYGDMQYRNVPVVVTSFRVELPDNVDYYATKINDKTGFTSANSKTGNMVPTVSTITISLLPMYSREELLGLKQVTDYIKPDDTGTQNLRQRGFL